MPMHQLSPEDRYFQAAFEARRIIPAAFDHRAHIRLAYTYLAEHDDDTASERLRGALRGFLRHHGVDPAKYHETLTHAWILAVRHFMVRSAPCASAGMFIEQHPALLDTRIMMTHYSAEVLFSPEARERFVEPNLSRIPRHAG